MKIIRFFLSPLFMGVLFFVFAFAMAAATFIENDFGSAASFGLVYNTKWFELIMLLLASNLVGQLIIFKLFRKDKLPVAIFHLAFILIIAGAAITRYTGWEGTMHIREGETVNTCYSDEKYIGVRINDENGLTLAEDTEELNIAFASKYRKILNDGTRAYKFILSEIVPNAIESVTDDPGGEPLVSLLVSTGMAPGDLIILKKGESQSVSDVTIGFESTCETDISIKAASGNFLISSKHGLSIMNMMSEGTSVTGPGEEAELRPMQVYSVQNARLVPRALTLAGEIRPAAVDPSRQNTGQNALVFNLSGGDESHTIYVWNRQGKYISSASVFAGGREFEVSYGAGVRELPFGLKLNDFILEHYPGSTSPSGYKSDVTVTDKERNHEEPYIIFMNNILKYRGFRFYQSSYDQDELGTILSVSHDMAGMIVTYTGYGLLLLFIILSLIIKTSSFRNIKASAWSSPLRKTSAALILILVLSGLTSSYGQHFIPDKKCAEEFGKVLVQDQKGRTKPLYALSSDILRKVARENKFEGSSSMQVFLGIVFDFERWSDVPLIRVSDRELQESLDISGNMAAFSDLVDMSGRGTYRLSGEVDAAYQKSPGERNKRDKEVMKVDERVNIVYMIYRGDFLRIFPLKDGTTNWGSPGEAIINALGREDSLYLANVLPLLAESLQKGDIASAGKITETVRIYQERFSGYQLPSEFKARAEILYYKIGIFERLFPFYSMIGATMLIALILNVIWGKREIRRLLRILVVHLAAGFLFHTFAFVLRWYISGHSPMSNGYESMIFISWVTLLAGFIFSRRSAFTLPATGVLSGLTLMVAHLSFMDPEITSLVPVLQSYWLTLHVSVITSSYAFFGLGFLLGLISLILVCFSGRSNLGRISETIDELTVINFKTLTLGLYFLTAGTFLGAVWANESWGRYWGWDPKETWSLITIIVYAFVTHSRMIPGLKSIYTFNILSLFAFSSVLMTYFGVNYYLSGLHSYAGGDPVPVPIFVYITILMLVALSLTAYIRYRSHNKNA